MIFNGLDIFNNTLTMMILAFNKYQGTGNDFIIIDNRDSSFNPSDTKLINKLCDRRFGIGADGLILVSNHQELDFEMKYFNSDGNLGSMCGNGGRCTAHFAFSSGIAERTQAFLAFDGIHEAVVENEIVRLHMSDVAGPKLIEGSYFINTGSPHYVIFAENIDKIDVAVEGKKIRNSSLFAPGGTNVNFVEMTGNGIYVRTFERGVEDETLSCGTGVTASALASVLEGHFDTNRINVRTKGGNLSVECKIEKEKISNIWLCGPATFVFKGEIEV
jgi:diaminopimelate epimerase